MLKDFKEKDRLATPFARCGRQFDLIGRLGTADSLLALSELIRSTAVTLCIFLITAFILFNKQPFAEAMLRVTAALALDEALLRFENRAGRRNQ